MDDETSRRKREAMVKEQLEQRGIQNPRVLDAMRKLPREAFVEYRYKDRAYEDNPLPIGEEQTCSQPYMVARVCELADPKPTDRVLEIGAGCGYQSAVLSLLAKEVYAVERIARLAHLARVNLAGLRIGNVEIGIFDGSGGWSDHAPYDVIAVAAGAPSIPLPLLDQLADGGRLIVPVGTQREQKLAVVRRRGEEFDTEYTTPCIFVNLIGRYGWGGSGTPRA